MNFKFTKAKIIISLIIAIIAGALYMTSKYVSYNAQTAGFILGFMVIFILTHIVYSLVQKK